MVEEESASGGVYVNLLKNPERFTGYAGHQAARIWAAIYDENCFTAQHTSPLLLDGFECKEKRVFYKIISGMSFEVYESALLIALGLHASISTHVCAQYFDTASKTWVIFDQCRYTKCLKEAPGFQFTVFY